MAYDGIFNFGYATVAIAPSPATSGTTLSLTNTLAARFADPATVGAYNVVVWAANQDPLPSNSEVIRITAKGAADSGGTGYTQFTIARLQEQDAANSMTARSIQVGDQIAANITKKTLADIQTILPNDLTTTGVVYITSGGVLAVDVTNLAWTDYRLNIRNMSVGQDYSTAERGYFVDADTGDLYVRNTASSGGQNNYYDIRAAGAHIYRQRDTGDTTWTELARLDTTGLGIGTATPAERVHVKGGSLKVEDTGGTKAYRLRTSGGSLDLEAGGANLYLSTWSGAGFSGTQYNQMIFDAGGANIQVQRSMDVSGNVAATNTVSASAVDVSADGDALITVKSVGSAPIPAIVGYSSRGTLASPTGTLTNDMLLDLSAHGYDGTGYTPEYAAIYLKAAQDWAGNIGANGTYISFITTDIDSTTPSERMRIYDNGNIALDDFTNLPGAASNPDYKVFHLASPTVGGATMYSMASKNLHTSFFGDYSGTFVVGSEGTTYPIDFKTGVVYSNSDTLGTGTTRLRIKGDGKVGIGLGSTDPTSQFHIKVSTDADIGIISQANSATQSGNLQEWRDYSGATLAQVGPTGAIQASNLSGTNTGNETTTTVGSLINGATAKATPVDADYIGLMDSAASNILKKLSWANVKATLKTYFDTLYQAANANLTTWAGKTAPTGTVVGTTDTQTLTNKTLTTPTIASIVNTGTLTLPTSTDTLLGRATTDTLTNKDLKSTTNTFAAVTTTASSATPTPTGNSRENELYLTALAVGATFAAPSGTPTNGNKLMIRIKDNGSAQTLAWNAIYRAIGIALPSTTTASKTMYIAAKYNSADSKWDVLAASQEV